MNTTPEVYLPESPFCTSITNLYNKKKTRNLRKKTTILAIIGLHFIHCHLDEKKVYITSKYNSIFRL